MNYTKKCIVILLAALGFGAGAAYLLHPGGTPSAGPVTPARAGEQTEKQQYTCGMHPFIIQDEPGDCPICGMALTPVKNTSGGQAGGTEATNVITIDPVTIQNMGVRTEPVQRRTISHTIRTTGLVSYQEPLQYSVTTKIAGWVERLHVNETGQMVSEGAPLLDIYSPELVAAQEEFLLALENEKRLRNSPFAEVRAGAERLLAASRNRLRFWDISEAQIRALEETGTIQKTLTLHAPYSGIVTAKHVNDGMYVKPGMNLFTISDISRVWVLADIYEYELPWLAVGQKADVILPFAGNRTLTGTVTYIYPFVEAKTRTVKARLAFDNPGLELKPDMYVNVRIHAQPRTDVLAVPTDAILHSGDSRTVFVALGDGKFEPRRVKTGLSSEDGYTEIIDGLSPGERVVTSAQFMLDSESTLRAAIQKMLEARPSAAAADAGVDDLFDDEAPARPAEENLEELF